MFQALEIGGEPYWDGGYSRRGQERVMTSWVLSIKAIGSAPMPGKEFLREQIERARRLAKALTRTEDRDRLLAVADDYQSQLAKGSALDIPCPRGTVERVQ
jgi:hypothetical protein